MTTLNETKTYIYYFDSGKHDGQKYKEVSREFVVNFIKNKAAVEHLEKKGKFGGFLAHEKGELA